MASKERTTVSKTSPVPADDHWERLRRTRDTIRVMDGRRGDVRVNEIKRLIADNRPAVFSQRIPSTLDIYIKAVWWTFPSVRRRKTLRPIVENSSGHKLLNETDIVIIITFVITMTVIYTRPLIRDYACTRPLCI